MDTQRNFFNYILWILVHSGGYNKYHRLWLIKQQTFISQGARSWEAQQALADLVSGQGRVSSSETIFFQCALIHM